ncbi:MAG: hypothetical protein MJE68_25420, partial [Proteobacteria bacterium]|nr:hypothetical protein [Pseudomonadota bacterium]
LEAVETSDPEGTSEENLAEEGLTKVRPKSTPKSTPKPRILTKTGAGTAAKLGIGKETAPRRRRIKEAQRKPNPSALSQDSLKPCLNFMDRKQHPSETCSM